MAKRRSTNHRRRRRRSKAPEGNEVVSASPDEHSAQSRRPGEAAQDLNFKVDPEFHLAFKVIAALRKVPMKQLLDSALRTWLEIYGTDHEKSLLPPDPKKN